jgi:transcriptional regulator with XRE-family HTH domain
MKKSSDQLEHLFHELESDADFRRTLLEGDLIHRVARRVMRFRKLLGMSQEDLANRMGTRQPRVARIESGEANLTLRALAHVAMALECCPEDLLTETPPRALTGRWERHRNETHVVDGPVTVRVHADQLAAGHRYANLAKVA